MAQCVKQLVSHFGGTYHLFTQKNMDKYDAD